MTKTLIGDICSFYKGASVPRDRMHDNGDYLYLHYGDLYKDFNTYIDIINPAKDIPFITSENNIKDTQFVDNGDIIYILTSETVEDLGKALMIINADSKKIVSGMETTIMRIKDRDVVNPAYLNYILQMPRFKLLLQQYVTGMKVFRAHPRDISRIYIDIPSMEKQNKIVDILSSFDKKIELNTRINTHLEEIVFSSFKSKFMNAEYSQTVGDYVVPKKGKNLLSKDAVSGYIPVIAGGLEPSVYHNKSNTKAPVLTISASGANAGYIRLWHVPVWSSDSSYIDTDIDSNVYFWYVLLKSRQSEIFDKQTGSAQPHVYPKHIAELTIPKYVVKDIEDFNISVTPYFELIGKNIEENKKLADMRDTLLPKLMSGEIYI